MNTLVELSNILARLERCPLNLARTELDMFHNAIQRDVHLEALVKELVRSCNKSIGGRVGNIVKDINSSQWADLGFANSAAVRAAVGYGVLECLLEEGNPKLCGENVFKVGAYYFAQTWPNRTFFIADAIKVFSEIFLHPLVSYLSGALEAGDKIVLLLSRYKQRTEWFPDDELRNVSLIGEEEVLERSLKRDFLRYLFDNGLVFSLESQPPSGSSKADILPVVPGLGILPIETKVFDGKSRNHEYITRGLAQTADYGRKFNSAYACFLVYNVVENSVLDLPGIATGYNVVRITITGVEILAIAANLRITLPSSQASKLNRVTILAPS